jgi:hypothetical protein
MTDNKRAANDAAARVDEAMAQAQVFASAWSLIGGPFNSGNELDDAEVERQALRALIRDLLTAERQAALSSRADGGKGKAVNQCDGCRVGAPLSGMGNHVMPDGGFMGCTKDRYTAPQAECAPRETQPVAFDKWADDYGFYDTATDVHQYARACAKDAWEMATRVANYPAKPGDLVQCEHCEGWSVAAPTPERADAGKDAALTDESIKTVIAKHRHKMVESYEYFWPDGEQDRRYRLDELAALAFARAILAANKEPK